MAVDAAALGTQAGNIVSPGTLKTMDAPGQPAPDEASAERNLVRRAQQGDHAAYAQLVRDNQSRIFRHLQNLTGSRDEALELSQDVFLKAWQALPGWRPEARFRTWLYRIASHVAYDLLRRRRVVSFESLPEGHEVGSVSEGPEERLRAKQAVVLLDAALARLSVEQREIVLLREVEDLSYQELSNALGIDEGTVKSRLARARSALAGIYTRMQT